MTDPEHTEAPTPGALETEASGATTVTIKWRTLTPFEIPLYYGDIPYDVILAEENGEQAGVIAGLLPPEILVEFRRMRPRMSDAVDLLQEMSTARGFASSGESPASTA